MITTDAQINAKYLSGINRLVIEHDRIKLPKLVEKIKHNSNAARSADRRLATTRGHSPSLMIDSEWSSSWDEVTKSRLIESLLINIPVMPIIVYEKEYNSHEVIDGRERLKTVVDLYSDRLRLTGLEIETNLEKCVYSTLPAQAKDKLNNRSLNLINCIPANNNQSELEIKKLINAVKERYSLQNG